MGKFPKGEHMKKELKRVMLAISVCMLGAASSGFAAVSVGGDLDGGNAPDVKVTTYTVGLGVAMLPDYEGSKDYKIAPVPYFRGQMASGQYLQLLGPTLTVNLLEGTTWQAGPLVRYRAERNDDVENNQVKLLKKVDAAIELGGFVGYQQNQWNARFDLAQDVAGGHEGFLATVTGGYTFIRTQATMLGLNLSTTYASSQYMDSYFTVTPIGTIRSGLKPYNASAGFKDVTATLIGRHNFNNHWGLMGTVQFKELVGGAAGSPIVDHAGSPGQLTVGVLGTYTF
jgi:outer membrane protein